MEKYLFAGPLLARLAEERFFLRLFSRSLQGLCGLLGLAALIEFFLAWKKIFNLPAEGMVGGILYQIAFVAVLYFVLHALLLAAAEVLSLEPKGRPAMSLASVLCRLAGEVYAFACAGLGLGAGLFTWFSGKGAAAVLKTPFTFLPFLKVGAGTFQAGALLIVLGLLAGLLALLVGRALAELFTLLNRAGRSD